MKINKLAAVAIIFQSCIGKKFIVVAVLLFTYSVNAQTAKTVDANLNGLELRFDAESGSILRMYHPATGEILNAKPDSAGIIDVAYPVEQFEPLRLASRYSKQAQISVEKDSVVIHWDSLGASRNRGWFNGKVSATVIIRTVDDGKSVSMSCRVQNLSDHSIPQVLFPDFYGILPFCGEDGTEFRTATTAVRPFVDMMVKEHDNFYALYDNTRWFKFGDVFDKKNLVTKWMDIGGLKSGLSIFKKTWGTNGAANEGVFLQLSELTNKLRYMATLYTSIPPGASWNSDEFIVTPHENGWAKGIVTYRNWVKQNIKREYPLPDHIRDGLGYRSIWMKNSFFPEDPENVNFKMTDLPAVAKEAKANGLYEMVLWCWYPGLELPLKGPNRYVGTEEEMAGAIADCKKLGVNVSPFLNLYRVRNDLAWQFGVKQNNESYVYDPDFIPTFLPRYSSAWKGPTIPQSNPKWQEVAYNSVKRLIDQGITSFCWDQFFSNTGGPENYLDTLMTRLRKYAKEKNPQSSFSGEAGTNIEFESKFLEYTWNWNVDSADYRPLITAFPEFRINTNIDRSFAEVKYGFADNIYLNVWPRKPDGIHGSDYLENHPKLAAALKQCARLRKQFLNYFVSGTFIADNVLTQRNAGLHVAAYVLPKSLLVILINKGERGYFNIETDIKPWLPSANKPYKLKVYNDGILASDGNIRNAKWKVRTPVMNNLDIVMYEVSAE